MANVGAIAQQLYAEIILRDKTQPGADSARNNIKGVGDEALRTNSAVEKTSQATSSAERAYERLQRRLEPLAALQEKMERDERTLARARDFGVITVERYERNMAQLNEEFSRAEERLDKVEGGHERTAAAANDNAEAMRGAASAAGELEDRLTRQESSLSTLANTAINTVGSIAGLATGFISLKLAEKDAIDFTSKLSIGLGLLSRVLPIAGVIALTLTFVKLGVEGVKAINNIIDSSVRLAKVQREAEGQVAAAIASTGGAADRTIEDIRAVAAELQSLSNTADEVTIRAGAQLLTFTNIRGENFDRGLRIGNDVAARLDRDPEQVALQLGKALNDPVRNLGALTESGIQFSDGQRNLIKSLAEVGEVATAQSIILAELETQFEGAGAAQREAEGGAVALANAWSDLKEELGDGVVSQTSDDMDRLARAVGDPVWKGFFSLLGNIIGRLEGLQIAARAALLQFAADTLRGAGIVFDTIAGAVGRAADALGRMVSTNAAAFFAGVAAAAAPVVNFVNSIGDKIDEIAGKAEALYNRLPAPVRNAIAGGAEIIRDAAPGGVLLSPTLAFAGIGRRAREAEPETDAAARSAARAASEAASIEKIAEHFEAAAARQKEYYEFAKRNGVEALERRNEERALLKEIDEITKGLPAAEAERVKQAKLVEASYKRQLADLEKINREREERIVEDVGRANRAAVGIGLSTVGDINDQRRAFSDAFERALRQFQPDLDAQRFQQETARAEAEFNRILLDKLEAANDNLERVVDNTADRSFEQSFLEKLEGIAQGVIRAAGAGRDVIRSIGDSLSTIRDPNASTSDKILGSIESIGSSVSNAIALIPGAQPVAAVVAAASQVAGFVSDAINLFKDLFGKRSDFTAQAVFNPVTGRIAGARQDRGAEENARARDAFLDSLFSLTDRLTEFTGGFLANRASTSANEAFLNVKFQSDRRTGEPFIDIGYQGPNGQPVSGGRFTDVEAALDEALRLTIGALRGGNEALIAYAKIAASAGRGAEEIFDGLEKISDALDLDDRPVDELQRKLDALIDAFDGLDTSSGALGRAFEQAIETLSARANEDTRKALDAILNPQRSGLADEIESLNARRRALENVNAQGGNVDLRLFDELARRQLLAGFDIPQRLSEGADPARASVDNVREQQRLELDSLKSIVGRFGVTLEDVAALQRAQVFERRRFFEGLSEEDRLRLSGQADDFLDLSGQYELAVDRLLEQSERLVEGFEERAADLRDFIDRERAGVADYDRAIAELDRRFGQGDPARRVDVQTDTVDDLRSRALVAEDTVDRRFAREQLPQAVQDLVEIAQGAGASSPLAQEAARFGRAALVEVRNARDADATAAERSLAALEQSRDILEDIRDLLAAPQLDAAALAERALALPPDFAERETVIGLARTVIGIQEALFEQNERITAALEALTPEDVGLTAPDSFAANDNSSPSSPAAFTAGEAGQAGPPQTATAGGGATSGSQQSDVVTGLYFVAKRLEAIQNQDAEYYRRQLRDNSNADRKLNQLVNLQ